VVRFHHSETVDLLRNVHRAGRLHPTSPGFPNDETCVGPRRQPVFAQPIVMASTRELHGLSQLAVGVGSSGNAPSNEYVQRASSYGPVELTKFLGRSSWTTGRSTAVLFSQRA
jgi:hypothetical protein